MSGKAPKQRESANERALADVSRRQIQRYENRFSPLIDDLDSKSQEDRSQRFRGVGNADTMQTLGTPSAPGSQGFQAQELGQRALGGSLTDGNRMSTERQQSLTKGVMDAATGSQQTAMEGFKTSANISNQNARAKLVSDISRRGQNLDMVGSIVGMGADQYMSRPRSLGDPNIAKIKKAGIDPYVRHDIGLRDSRTGARQGLA